MTFEDAITLQPQWVRYWLSWLLIAVLILPLFLLRWRKSMLAGIATVLATGASGFAQNWLYDQMGYVKLLGLAHILFWTPLAFYLVSQLRRQDMPVWPRRIIVVILVSILISLAFDYTDALRYILGERTPVPGTV